MRKTLAVARKELRQVSRDPFSLVMLLGVPAFMLLLYGFALNFDVRHVPLFVADRSGSEPGRALVAAFVNSGYFDLVGHVRGELDPKAVLDRREAKAVLVLREDLGRRLAAGLPATVGLIVDGTDASTATTLLGYASAIVASMNEDLARQTERASYRLEGGMTRAAPEASPIAYQPRVWYNPELRSTQFLVPGLIGFILMLTAVLSTALSIVREKERGTMEQLRVTSLRPHELILGKALPYLVISLLATALILVAARLLFNVAVRGSYLDLFVATLVYLVGALGFGLLVSTLAESQAMAFQIGSVTSMLPAIFLSGFIFPIRSMPPALRVVTHAFPARYFLVVLRGIILKGAGLGPYARDMGFLVLYATVVLAVAFVRLRRREA